MQLVLATKSGGNLHTPWQLPGGMAMYYVDPIGHCYGYLSVLVLFSKSFYSHPTGALLGTPHS